MNGSGIENRGPLPFRKKSSAWEVFNVSGGAVGRLGSNQAGKEGGGTIFMQFPEGPADNLAKKPPPNPPQHPPTKTQEASRGGENLNCCPMVKEVTRPRTSRSRLPELVRLLLTRGIVRYLGQKGVEKMFEWGGPLILSLFGEIERISHKAGGRGTSKRFAVLR